VVGGAVALSNPAHPETPAGWPAKLGWDPFSQQSPPLGAGIPRVLRMAAICLSDWVPLACISRTIGSKSADRLAALTLRTATLACAPSAALTPICDDEHGFPFVVMVTRFAVSRRRASVLSASGTLVGRRLKQAFQRTATRPAQRCSPNRLLFCKLFGVNLFALYLA
jgi:hypothetical protein